MSNPFTTDGDQRDPSDLGGVVVSSSAPTGVGRRSVARIGDRVSSPNGKAGFPVARDDATTVTDDPPVAGHGDETTDGATLIAGAAVGG